MTTAPPVPAPPTAPADQKLDRGLLVIASVVVLGALMNTRGLMALIVLDAGLNIGVISVCV